MDASKQVLSECPVPARHDVLTAVHLPREGHFPARMEGSSDHLHPPVALSKSMPSRKNMQMRTGLRQEERGGEAGFGEP